MGIERVAFGIFDNFFGNPTVKDVLQAVFGDRYFRLFVHLARYRARHMVREGETCLLAGVFYESTVRDFSAVVGPRGRVIVVEANPDNIAKLRRNVDGSNVVYVNYAVWNEKGQMEFIASVGDEQGYNRLNTPEMQQFPYHMDESPRTIQVRCNTLDAIAEELNVDKIHHINLTVNGAELQALDGIEGLLRQNDKLRIYINSENPDPASAVLQKLRTMGFRVYTSQLIRTINKKIRLIRIYAVHG